MNKIPKETKEAMIKAAKKAKPGKPGIVLTDENYNLYKRK